MHITELDVKSPPCHGRVRHCHFRCLAPDLARAVEELAAVPGTAGEVESGLGLAWVSALERELVPV